LKGKAVPKKHVTRTNAVKKEKRPNGRGSIYPITLKSGRISYRAAIYDVNRKLRTKNFKKLTEAEDWLSEQRRARELGENTYAVNPKMKLSEYLDGWLATHQLNVKHSTYHSYRSVIDNQINPVLGNMNASSLTTKAIEIFLGGLVAKGLGAGTINLSHRVLSVAYNTAVRHGDLPRNPVLYAKKPRVQSVEIKPIPRRDFEKLYIEAMKNPYMHARIEIGGMVGLRPGEVLGLKWSDIDWDTRLLTLERQVQREKGKGLIFQSVKQDTVRSVLLSEEQVRILSSHRRYQSLNKATWVEDDDLIFPNLKGKKCDAKRDRRLFEELLVRAEVAHYRLYQLRKTAYSNMASVTDMRTLKDYSGHGQISTLMKHYVYSNSDSMKQAVSAMDKLRPANNS
jgi:integrase